MGACHRRDHLVNRSTEGTASDGPSEPESDPATSDPDVDVGVLLDSPSTAATQARSLLDDIDTLSSVPAP